MAWLGYFRVQRAWLMVLVGLGCLACGQVTAQDADRQETRGEAAHPDHPGQVSIYLTVHAKKDKGGGGLKAGELAITDAGQAVDSHEISIAPASSGDERLVSFLFDRVDQAGTRDAALAAMRILKQIKDHSGAMGVWAIDTQLHVLQPYTVDRAAIGTAIRVATAQEQPRTSAGADAQRTTAPESAGAERSPKQAEWDSTVTVGLRGAEQIVMERHTPVGIASIVAIAEAERKIAGRKAIVYFTQGSPTDLNAADTFRAASQVLRDAQVSLFVVDVNALDSNVSDGMMAAIAMGSQAASNHGAIASAPKPLPGTNPFAPGPATLGLTPIGLRTMNDTMAGIELGLDGNKNLLGQLAESTGGVATNADGNAHKLSRQLVAELTSYYKISYELPASRRDGKFHAVTVSALSPGVKVVSHPGYFALKPGGGSEEPFLLAGASRGLSELDRLASGSTGGGLLARSAVLRFGTSATGMRAVIAVEAPISQLELKEDENTNLFSLHVSVAAEIRDAMGAPVARFMEEFRRHGSIDAEEQVRSEVLSTARSVSLPTGEYQLVTMVRDWDTGRIGRSTQAFHLGGEEGAGLLSDVVLVRSTEEKGTGPLQYGQVRIVPNLSGEQAGGKGTASLYFQLYPEAGAAETALRVEVSKGGKLIATVPLHLNVSGDGSRDATRLKEGLAQVATVKLRAGAGAYELTLCLDEGGTVTRRHVSVVDETGGPPALETAAVSETEQVAEKAGSEVVELGLKPATGLPLPEKDRATLIAAARESALSYARTLPNFMCVERIARAADRKGTGAWKQRDSIVELLRYHDKEENRKILEVNGEKSSLPAERIEGARSNGEFGAILEAIFAPAAGASFEWEKSEEQGGAVLQVFSYKVGEKNSEFFVTDHNGDKLRAAFHGLVFVDSDTRSVRRLVAQTDGLPAGFGVKSSWMAVNYDYIAINGHDYLLPVRGEVGLQQGKHAVVLNQLRFSEYRRFGSRSRIVEMGAGQGQP